MNKDAPTYRPNIQKAETQKRNAPFKNLSSYNFFLKKLKREKKCLTFSSRLFKNTKLKLKDEIF